MTPSWFWIFSTTPYFSSQFFFYFFVILAQLSSRCLPWILLAISVESIDIYTPFLQHFQDLWFVNFWSRRRHFERSFFFDHQLQMTIVRRKIPVCIMLNDLCTTLKYVFIARMKWFYHYSLLKCFFYFFASSLVSYFVKKTACKGRFRIFFLFAFWSVRKDPFEL